MSSASEVQSHLYVALDQGYLEKKGFDKIYQKTVSIKKLVLGFIRYLNTSKQKGRTLNFEP